MPQNLPKNLKREKTHPFCGRLIVLDRSGPPTYYAASVTDNYQHLVALNFPSMPETVDLARSTDYAVVATPAFPDGVHQYRGTSPLEIPISFGLHAFDREFCPEGALSLLQFAAVLHALVLPFGSDGVRVNVGPSSARGNQPDGSQVGTLSRAATGSELVGQLPVNTYDIRPPPTTYLELIVTDRTSPGVCCVGYVKSVKAILKGPWLRGPGISQNLPTSGEFSFVFVHHPGHGNAYNYGRSASLGEQSERHAYAHTVRDRLFNTRDLFTHANYHGFADTLDQES